MRNRIVGAGVLYLLAAACGPESKPSRKLPEVPTRTQSDERKDALEKLLGLRTVRVPSGETSVQTMDIKQLNETELRKIEQVSRTGGKDATIRLVNGLSSESLCSVLGLRDTKHPQWEDLKLPRELPPGDKEALALRPGKWMLCGANCNRAQVWAKSLTIKRNEIKDVQVTAIETPEP